MPFQAWTNNLDTYLISVTSDITKWFVVRKTDLHDAKSYEISSDDAENMIRTNDLKLV